MGEKIREKCISWDWESWNTPHQTVTTWPSPFSFSFFLANSLVAFNIPNVWHRLKSTITLNPPTSKTLSPDHPLEIQTWYILHDDTCRQIYLSWKFSLFWHSRYGISRHVRSVWRINVIDLNCLSITWLPF